jgi:hypothetical protein
VVGQPFGLLEGVRRHDDGGAARPDLVDQVVDVQAAVGVQAGGGLVEEHDLGPPHEGGRQGQALPLAAGESADRRPREAVDAEAARQVVDRRGVRIQAGQVAQQPHRRRPRREPAGLQHHPDPAAMRGAGAPRVRAEHLDGTGVRALEADGALDRRGLAGTVRPEDRRYTSGRRRPRHPVAGDRPAEPPDETVQPHRILEGGHERRV